MRILKKDILAQTPGTPVTRLEVYAPQVAAKVKAGQFVVLMVNGDGERIPLTVVDKDAHKGSIVLIFQEVGLTTRLLGQLNVGDSLYALVGPLGNPTQIESFGKVIIIGGGVGVAEIYPVAKAMQQQGNAVVAIIGARSKELLILENELKNVSSEFYVTTDDGAYGRKGFVTDVLKELLAPAALSLLKPGLIYAVGPIPMMKKVAMVSRDSGIKTLVSLNALMVDATGMCGCCRVTVGGKTKFSCVDGPEFLAHDIDWEELEKRNRIYVAQEKHACRLLDAKKQ